MFKNIICCAVLYFSTSLLAMYSEEDFAKKSDDELYSMSLTHVAAPRQEFELTTIQLLKFAADRGHIKSQTSLGYIYSSENFVEQDDKLSLHYFELAAFQGDANAQYEILSCLNGKLVEEIEKKPISDDEKYIKILCLLGQTYRECKNYDYAEKFFEMAADQGVKCFW